MNDTTLSVLDERFQQIKRHGELFNVLYDISKIKDTTLEALWNKCTKLCDAVTFGRLGDASYHDYKDEMKVHSSIVKP